MALEPITRQEQIIAGKDLEPITRMERFLKEYGGGAGGVVSDEQIKNAVENYLDENPIGVDLSVTGATVGQTVTISAVDENGAPTAWKAVDFPSGGAGTWKKIVDFSITEEVSTFSINQDLWGSPINIFEQEALILGIAVPTASNDSKKSTTFLINNQLASTIQNSLYDGAWNSRRSLRIGHSPWPMIDVEKTWYYGTGTDAFDGWIPAANPVFGWNGCIPALAGKPINSVGYSTNGVFGIGSKIVVYVKG